MLFNSIDFAIFSPIVFILYWFLTNKNLRLQNLLIVTSSYVFYGWWDWRFLSLILFSTIVDFSVGRKLHNEENQVKRKILLWTSILVNLGFLGFFKYYNFFLDNFISAFSFFGTEIKANSLNIILPVGISFYTFQTLSYTIDVYKRKLEPTTDIIAFSAFVSFFPQLVAGPIERATHLLPQFYTKRKFSFLNIQFGFIRILNGLFKKVVIADNFSNVVDLVYNNPESFGGIHYIVATIFFAFQIYCDFSGYSDIAIGTARIFGFKLMENFRMPYLSKSIGEFWKRWHISLSTWFRDYVYIPLGGNRVSKSKTLTNIFIVFLVSGFWHGAKWTFVVWGAIHGVILIVENLIRLKGNIQKSKYHRASASIKVTLVFFIVCFAWIFFRSNSMNDAAYITSRLFDFSLPLAKELRGMTTYLGLPLWKFVGYFVLIGVLFIQDYLIENDKLSEISIIRMHPILRWSIYTFIILTILLFGSFDVEQFVYFQF